MRSEIIITTVAVLAVGVFSACRTGSDEKPNTGIPENAALKITGKVDNVIGWMEEEVRAMDTIEAESINSAGETATYTGVPLNTLLELAKLQQDATTIVVVAEDGSSAEVDLTKVLACDDCIVSFRNKGGFSTVLPGFTNDLQVKGVVEIKLR